ncbi:MAG: PIN domain-containing protein [Treponema sp.]|jgi:predicted nucleic acid-binding protein|nr:PIN domain-containing protein [Treponema sp.]
MDAASSLLRLCFDQKCSGYIAAHSITNIFYIIRKQFSVSKRKEMLLGLCEFMEVVGIEKKQVIDALVNENFDDLEDGLQIECACAINADYIITRNIEDFSASPIPAVLPEDFLQKMVAL